MNPLIAAATEEYGAGGPQFRPRSSGWRHALSPSKGHVLANAGFPARDAAAAADMADAIARGELELSQSAE